VAAAKKLHHVIDAAVAAREVAMAACAAKLGDDTICADCGHTFIAVAVAGKMLDALEEIAKSDAGGNEVAALAITWAADFPDPMDLAEPES
jgi:hypothetical protein